MRIVKRATAQLLGLVMTIGLLMPTGYIGQSAPRAYADAEGSGAAAEEVLFSEDFESAPLGAALPPGLIPYIQGTRSTVEVAELAGNRVVKLNREATGTEGSPGIVYDFGGALTSGALTVTFDVYREPGQRFIVYGLGEDMNFGNTPALVFVDHNRHYTMNPTYQEVGTNQANRWYSYTLTADLTARTFELAIDGVPITKGPTAFRTDAAIERFAIYNRFGRGGSDNGYQLGAYYVDNLEIRYARELPQPISPAHLAEDVSDTPTFVWRDAGADSYTLIVARTPDFSEVSRTIAGITEPTYTLTSGQALDYDTAYYWKVVAEQDGEAWESGQIYGLRTQLDASGDRVPVVFETAPHAVGPGQTVQVFGERLDGDTLLLKRLPDWDEATIAAAVGTASADPEAIDPAGAAEIDAEAVDERVLRAVMPAADEWGAYALWAVNGSKRGEVRLLNRPTVYYASPDRVNLAGAREVRVIGRNLSHANGDSVSHVYLHSVSGAVYAMELDAVSPYSLEFELPQTLPPGEYGVWVHSGHGGAYGWGEVQTLTVVDEPAPAATYAITDYGAVADDAASDTLAIQTALDTAAAAGGGRVLVPAGEYLIDDTLAVDAGVELAGAGRDGSGAHLSRIRYADTGPIGPAGGGLGPAMVELAAHTALTGLELTGSVSVDRGIVIANGASDVVVRGNKLNTHFPTTGIKGYFGGVYGSGAAQLKRITVEDNAFDGYNAINFDRLTYSRIQGNTVQVRRYTPIVFSGSSRNIVEGNTIDGRNTDGKREANRGITFNYGTDQTGIGPNEMNYVAHNVITYVGNEVYPTNDGEYVLFDNLGDSSFPNTHYFGDVSEASGSEVTVADVSWTTDQMAQLYVLIVDGKGRGQYRKVVSNDHDTLVVDRPWELAPNYTSKLVVARFHAHNLVVGNTAAHNKGNSFLLWGNVIDNVLDGNEAEQGGAGITALDHSGNPNQYGAAYYNTIQHTVAPSVRIGYSEYGIGRNPRDAVIAMGNTLRGNTSASVGMRLNSIQDPSANVRETLIEANAATTPIDVTVNARDTLLRHNRLAGVAWRYSDAGSGTVIEELELPQPPASVKMMPQSDYAELVWDAVYGAEGYNVFRSIYGAQDYALLNAQPLTATTYADAAAAPGELYDYRVAAWTAQAWQGEPGAAIAGFGGAGIASSSLDYSSEQGEGGWSYRDADGELTYNADAWRNADDSVILTRHTAAIDGSDASEAIRQWEAPYDGEARLYGVIRSSGTSLPHGSAWRLEVNGSVLASSALAEQSVIDSVYQVRQGDAVRFVVAGPSGAGLTAVETEVETEYAVHFTREAPIALTPQSGAQEVLVQPTFHWMAIDSADTYTLIVDDDEDLSSPVAELSGLTGDSYALSGSSLLPHTTYYWQVRAHAGADSWETGRQPAVFTTGSAGRTAVLEEDYNATLAGALPPGYSVSSGDGDLITIAGTEDRYDHALRISSAGNGREPRVSFALPQAIDSGVVEMSWDVRHTGNSQLHFALFPGDGPISFKGLFSAYGHYWVDWKKASPYTSTVGQWRHVKLVLDLDAGEYVVDLDGERLGLDSGQQVFELADSQLTTITAQFYADRWDGAVEFDNLKVMTIDE
ncbi:right-handed parallel beta-helix repeat-containing protein [Paenibacillus sp. IB182496]|uniref:Right-handed parallel beta-helix repeat-containing protein n=1 Tax=Paenibacillus sabuli TaxID=2772509 RepID=A0A927BUJ6_9BACL|nr:right-handed parallel beta-helix repeat-containing protein [Paenibacillus sabuli]MBD2847093.1 right-handed parallel beta-helix repeat-containing protein [Paenibacillus sabuli]